MRNLLLSSLPATKSGGSTSFQATAGLVLIIALLEYEPMRDAVRIAYNRDEFNNLLADKQPKNRHGTKNGHRSSIMRGIRDVRAAWMSGLINEGSE